MKLKKLLSFSSGNLPMIMQSEISECGLASLAMIATYHGHKLDLNDLRHRFSTSIKGATLEQIKAHAKALDFIVRPLRAELEHLEQLRTPAILHWDMNHFVVLKSVRRGKLVIHDPARGVVEVLMNDASSHFTGVAVELNPSPDFNPQISKDSPKLEISQLWRGLHGFWKLAGQILFVTMALQVFSLIAPLFAQLAIDKVVISHDLDLLDLLAVGFLLLVAIRILTELLRGLMVLFLSTHMTVQMASRLFNKLLRLPLGFFERRHVGDIVSRFESLNSIQRTLSTNFIETIVDGVMIFPLIAMMFVYDWALAAISCSAVVIYLGVRLFYYRHLYAATQEKIHHDAKRQSTFLESIRGMQTIKLLNAESERELNWYNCLVDGVNAGVRAGRLKIIGKVANTTIFGVENILIVWIGALAVMNGTLTIGMLVAYLAWRQSFSDKVTRLVERLIELKMLGLHSERVADIALESNEEKGHAAPVVATGSKVPDLKLTNVTFSYGGSEDAVLKKINLYVAAGETVAITGRSGSGKTTLMKVITGLVRPSDGSVEINGQSIFQIGLDTYRSMVGAVMQDDSLFAGSIIDNICFFSPTRIQKDVEQAARMAGIHKDILTMPMGYNTRIGDMGSSLSGGQKQRVLIARALYRKPRILFLDEASSHLDEASEAHFMQSISKLKVTAIIIAHRKETISYADRVIDISSLGSSGSDKIDFRESSGKICV